MNTLVLTDYYKIHHNNMYEPGMTKLYSNFTPRKSRLPGIDKVVVFGIQHFILEYLIKHFNEKFFGWLDDNPDQDQHLRFIDKDKVINEYKRHCQVDTKHIEDLWDLGYLPIEIKALDEGTLCPIGVPLLTITNTHPDPDKFAWLVNYLETLISCSLWQPITSATIAYEYKKNFVAYAKECGGNLDFVQWQGHDFSMRGMSSVESAILSGMGHLTSFTGTDTIPAIYQLEKSYDATGLIGASVPATEHSVMCMGQKESEIDTFRRLLKLYPTGILSIVSDTWDLWKVLTEYLPILKDEILARDGKLVIRPDSGDPVDIICGYDLESIAHHGRKNTPEEKGVVELLWNIFGGTTNDKGFNVLDSHVNVIYGDSIILDRQKQILARCYDKGFLFDGVLGIGSYTYQYNTRDTFGFAMKATYGEITKQVGDGVKETWEEVECREIFKDPVTSDGEKKSKKGLLQVVSNPKEDGTIICRDQCAWDQESNSLLTTVFKDGKLIKRTTLEEIRNRLNGRSI